MDGKKKAASRIAPEAAWKIHIIGTERRKIASAIDGFNLHADIALTVANTAVKAFAAGEAFNENFIGFHFADNFCRHGGPGHDRLADFHAAII